LDTIYVILCGVAGRALDDVGQFNDVYKEHLKKKGYKLKRVTMIMSPLQQLFEALRDPHGAGYVITGAHGTITPTQTKGEAQVKMVTKYVTEKKLLAEKEVSPDEVVQALNRRKDCLPKFIIWAFCYSGGVDQEWIKNEWGNDLKVKTVYTFANKDTEAAWKEIKVTNVGKLKGLGIDLVKTWNQAMGAGEFGGFVKSNKFINFLRNLPVVQSKKEKSPEK